MERFDATASVCSAILVVSEVNQERLQTKFVVGATLTDKMVSSPYRPRAPAKGFDATAQTCPAILVVGEID